MYTTIETLWNQGHNKSFISRATGHDWKTIDKVIKLLALGKDAPDRKPHPRKLSKHHDILIPLIQQGLSAVRIHEELNKEGIAVGYSTVKTEVRYLKRKSDIFIRVHSKAGEEAQVDFGYVGFTPDSTGKRRKTWIFNMRLSYSRLDYYEEVHDQRVETFIQCHINAFKFFGGVPATVKIDNLKAAILEANFYEPIYQRHYLAFSEFYGFQSLPCRVYRPNDKGKVESGIKYIKSNFFAGRKFTDKKQLQNHLSHWLKKANSRTHGTTKKVPMQIFNNEEKQALRPLPLEEFNLNKLGSRKVYHDCHIYVEHNYYSVPFSYVGKTVDISIGDKLIQIYDQGKLIASHGKLKSAGEFSTQKGHYPKYKCLSETEFQEKYQSKMAKIGVYAEQLFFKLKDERKTAWSRPVQGILSLSKTFSPEVVNKACQRALAFDALSYRSIKNICRNGTYLLPLDTNYVSYQGEL